MIARRSETTHPRFITIGSLIEIGNRYEWSADHRKGIRTSLNSFFEWALINGIVSDNPAALLPAVSGSPPNPRPAPDDIWEKLLADAPPRELMMARLAGEAGMRRAEVAVCHRRDLFREGAHWSLLIHGKGGKDRVLPITDNLAAAIIEFCPTSSYLFPSLDKWGNELAPHLSEHHVGKLLSALMPPGWSMHKLRHRFASRGLAGTNDLIAVQEALGHVSVATTQRYVKITTDKVRAVSEAAAPRRGAKSPDGAA
jgi:integrase